jgi:hypothetical protein
MDTHQPNVELQEAALATLLNVCLAPACHGDVFKGGIPVLYNVMDLHITQQRVQVCLVCACVCVCVCTLPVCSTVGVRRVFVRSRRVCVSVCHRRVCLVAWFLQRQLISEPPND